MPANPTYLKDKYGLDAGLHYVPGTPIYEEYEKYKDSSRAANDAKWRYDDAASSKKVRHGLRLSPGAGRFPRGPPNRMFFPEDHARLLPLAEAAFRTALDHAEKREAFNVRYEEVLKTKGGC